MWLVATSCEWSLIVAIGCGQLLRVLRAGLDVLSGLSTPQNGSGSTENGLVDCPTINWVTALAQTASKLKPQVCLNVWLSLSQIKSTLHSVYLVPLSVKRISISLFGSIYTITTTHTQWHRHTNCHLTNVLWLVIAFLTSAHIIQQHRYSMPQVTNVALVGCSMKLSGLYHTGEWVKYQAPSMIVSMWQRMTRPTLVCATCGLHVSIHSSPSTMDPKFTPVHSFTGTGCGTTNPTMITGCTLCNPNSFPDGGIYLSSASTT